jgi:hypothetical protein
VDSSVSGFVPVARSYENSNEYSRSRKYSYISEWLCVRSLSGTPLYTSITVRRVIDIVVFHAEQRIAHEAVVAPTGHLVKHHDVPSQMAPKQ